MADLAQVKEITRLACPEPDADDRATLTRITPRPKHWPKAGATNGDLMGHIDRLELKDRTKAAAAARVLEEFDRCRGGDGKGMPTS